MRSFIVVMETRYESGWSSHVTGMTDLPRPAVPTGLAVDADATDHDSIGWEWVAVPGVDDYETQFSTSQPFVDTNLPSSTNTTTSSVFHNLKAETNGYLRVRSVVGTGSDARRSDWSATSTGTTGAAPEPDPLAAPGNFVSTAQGDDSISLAWDSVDGADYYEVEQRAEDGVWVDASCGGGDNEVEETVCEATGLDEVTAYDFRVSAVPSSADTQLRASGWATLNNVETTGTRPTPPPTTVPGSEGDLNMIWESEARSITWRWDQVANRDWKYKIYYVEQSYNQQANPCPVPNAATWQDSDAGGYAISYSTASTSVTFANDPALEVGDVALLCVQTTWEDERGLPQYGNHSFAWAATAPEEPSLATEPYRDDDDAGDTKTIYWQNVAFDQGFNYSLHLVSARPVENAVAGTSGPAAKPNQAACDAGKPLPDETSGGRETFTLTRYDVTGLADYTSYHLCYRAENGDGSSRSDWAISSNGGVTLPPKPGNVSARSSSVAHDADPEWSFSIPTTGHPQEAASYTIRLYQETTSSGVTGLRTMKEADCAMGTIRNSADDADIYTSTDVSDDADRTRTHIEVDPAANDAGTERNKRNYLCVQSKVTSNRVSGWQLSSVGTQTKDPEN